MHAQDTDFTPSERLAIAYTDKPVSGWGGLVALVRYLDRLAVREALRQVLPDGRTSPNQIDVVALVLALWATVLTGGRRFAHAARLVSDEVIRATLGVDRLPSPMTLTRYFGGFVRGQVETLSSGLWSLVLAPRLRGQALGMVLDLDSTVFERYGHQEGSLKGHNPRKHGRPSHHPILAMLADVRWIVHAWLRSGNTGTARGVRAFLAETLARLPEEVRLYAVRADSGFFEREFLEDLEQRELSYAIAVRMTKPIQRQAAGLRSWRPFGQGLEVAEMAYTAPSWRTPRRLVVVREEIRERPDARGRRLIDVPGYTFHTVVTTLEHRPEDVWRFYNGRADSENRIKELKDDFGADGFCVQSFDGTEAVFRLICALFNLVALFKQEVLKDTTSRLMSLRTDVLVVGAILGATARRRVLRLGLRGRRRAGFAAWLDRVRTLPRSTASQLANTATALGLAPPGPWRSRAHRRRERASRLAWAFN